MTTNINIRISDTRRAARRHVAIPHTDLWTQDWWDAQTNPSVSVRQLIENDVAIHGVSDVLNRPSGRVTATPVAPAQPAAPAAPAVDPRDVELAALRDEVAGMRELLVPFRPFFTVLSEGKVV